jgi:hypothetical protein
MFRLLFSMLLAIALAPPQAAASDRFDTLDKGPRVGRTIPHSLAVRDHNDQHRDFKSLARRRGLILMFSRSLDW